MESKSLIISLILGVLLLGLGITACCTSCQKNNSQAGQVSMKGGDI